MATCLRLLVKPSTANPITTAVCRLVLLLVGDELSRGILWLGHSHCAKWLLAKPVTHVPTRLNSRVPSTSYCRLKNIAMFIVVSQT